MMSKSILYRKAQISDLSGIVKVNVDTWKTAYKGIISEKYLQSISYEDKKANWRQRLEDPTHGAIIHVAEKDSEEIVGFILATLQKFDPIATIPQAKSFTGQLGAIYVLKNYQGNKIGTELVKLVVKHLIENKIHDMIVWVLKESPYRRFYEKLGGKYLGEQFLEIGGRKYCEIAYGWENIKVILSNF
ncbi:MAG: GNAT family N-acetyltransferase [Candidatus Lokiarchaeota archaeon]|nr:GNAT family N-acetyltransferase [Candidatus Lokiarchaeota archaeon]